MFGPWYAATMLGLEAQRVIEMRFLKIAKGGDGAVFETQRMINEKIGAAIEATGTLLAGGSPDKVIARYREHVRDNVQRLSAS